MSDVLPVSHDWLALREAEDARARSGELVAALLPLLPPAPLVIHDLGSGTGSMMRWLAPLLPGPQTWVLHDWNTDLTDRALYGSAPRDRGLRDVSRISMTGELADLTAPDLTAASLVTASALLDVLTSEEVHAIARACIEVGVPVLFSLSVTGEVDLHPRDARDRHIEAAFNAHQRRLAGGRRLLGRYGGAIARGLFLQAGWHVRPVDTPWRLGDHESDLLGEWFDGWVDAAVEQRPELRADAAAYRALRASQIQRGQLSATVHHTDLLAWPR